ncbi:hypothetical protein [Streptomyces pseudovenezuelae]|uniref:hypothetical protein n=1 Tax=Streptomyces pseudovenezuelae TaxID=67350 RepID=UPI0036EF3EA2
MTAATRHEVVPFIASWSGEQKHSRKVVYSPARGGIAFADEQPEDRDQYGVLWNGRAAARGSGRPELGDVHPDRQRVAMQNLLCQVCGTAPDRTRRGLLWLLEDHQGDYPEWPNDALTTHPPLCLPHARKSLQACPHLRRGAVAVRVGTSEVMGVHGRLYAPSAFGPVRLDKKDVVAYGSNAARWVLAGQLVRALYDCTIVDLDEFRSRP